MRRTTMADSPALVLRAAQSDDEAFLLHLYSTTRAEEMAGTGWSTARRKDFLRTQFSAQQSGYRTVFPLALNSIILERRTPIGRLMVSRATDEIHLVDLALIPTRRNAGLGSRLLRDLMEEARDTNRQLRLQVLKNNPALRWYLRLGFSPAGENGWHLKMEWTPPRAHPATT
jgi:ribosomal protein S18 acetylase RimI-like enzyme